MDHYSKSKLKKSLVHFLMGKLFNGIAGLLYLLIVVRNLKKEEYGIYIGLISLLEIIYLFSGFGVTSFLQRYIPEYRVKYNNTILHRMVYKIFAFRFLFIMIFILIISGLRDNILDFFNISIGNKIVFIFGLYLIGEVMSRTQMEVFSALLLQGYQQWSLFLKNIIKLIMVVYFSYYLGELDLENLFIIESAQVYIALVVSFALIAIYFSKTEVEKNATVIVEKNNKTMLSFSLNSYAAQIMSLIYSQSALNLIVARYLGISEVAIFGFAQSIINLVKKYMPTYLLVGMIRPIFIAQFEKNKDSNEVSYLATFLLKINILILICLIVVIYFTGNDLISFMTNGKYVNISTLLIVLVFLLSLRSFHLVMNIVLTTYEKGKVESIATLISTSGIFVSLILGKYYGVYGVLAGAFICEILWGVISFLGLKRSGIDFKIRLGGFVRMIASGLIVFISYFILQDIFMPFEFINGAIIISVLYILFVLLFKAFNTNEKTQILGLLKK